jgi:hypothetical protein
MTRRPWLALCLLVLPFVCPLPGCSGTETGNPKPPAIELSVTAYSSEFGQVSVGRAGGKLRVDHAFVTLDRVELLTCSARGKSVTFDVGEVDLAKRPAHLFVAESDETDFCSARVVLSRGTGEVTSELAGRSTVLQGTREDGASFQVASELELTVNLASSSPSTPIGGRRLLLGFNLADWLDGVGVETATADNGTVSIDSTHAPEALATFDSQAKAAVALFDDADGNGQLASDNQTPAASSSP